MNTDQIKNAVEKFLNNRSIEFSFDHLGIKGNVWDPKNSQEMHAYTVAFKRADHRPASFSTEFFQGMGITEDPHATGVLYCLILDASVEGNTFEEWALDFGYDTDSRNAKKTYKACLKINKKLREMFSDSEIEELQRLLQDY